MARWSLQAYKVSSTRIESLEKRIAELESFIKQLKVNADGNRQTPSGAHGGATAEMLAEAEAELAAIKRELASLREG